MMWFLLFCGLMSAHTDTLVDLLDLCLWQGGLWVCECSAGVLTCLCVCTPSGHVCRPPHGFGPALHVLLSRVIDCIADHRPAWGDLMGLYIQAEVPS